MSQQDRGSTITRASGQRQFHVSGFRVGSTSTGPYFQTRSNAFVASPIVAFNLLRDLAKRSVDRNADIESDFTADLSGDEAERAHILINASVQGSFIAKPLAIQRRLFSELATHISDRGDSTGLESLYLTELQSVRHTLNPSAAYETAVLWDDVVRNGHYATSNGVYGIDEWRGTVTYFSPDEIADTPFLTHRGAVNPLRFLGTYTDHSGVYRDGKGLTPLQTPLQLPLDPLSLLGPVDVLLPGEPGWDPIAAMTQRVGYSYKTDAASAAHATGSDLMTSGEALMAAGAVAAVTPAAEVAPKIVATGGIMYLEGLAIKTFSQRIGAAYDWAHETLTEVLDSSFSRGHVESTHRATTSPPEEAIAVHILKDGTRVHTFEDGSRITITTESTDEPTAARQVTPTPTVVVRHGGDDTTPGQSPVSHWVLDVDTGEEYLRLDDDDDDRAPSDHDESGELPPNDYGGGWIDPKLGLIIRGSKAVEELPVDILHGPGLNTFLVATNDRTLRLAGGFAKYDVEGRLIRAGFTDLMV